MIVSRVLRYGPGILVFLVFTEKMHRKHRKNTKQVGWGAATQLSLKAATQKEACLGYRFIWKNLFKRFFRSNYKSIPIFDNLTTGDFFHQ